MCGGRNDRKDACVDRRTGDCHRRSMGTRYYSRHCVVLKIWTRIGNSCRFNISVGTLRVTGGFRLGGGLLGRLRFLFIALFCVGRLDFIIRDFILGFIRAGVFALMTEFLLAPQPLL